MIRYRLLVSVEQTIIDGCANARGAARALCTAATASKNLALTLAAARLRACAADLLSVNRRDVDAAQRNGLSAALVDRLTLNPQRIEAMARGLEEIARLPDPVGETIARWRRPNGLDISQVRIPLGVVAIIYESRPNVTADAAGLCLKAGNAAILKGGSEAFSTNQLLAQLIAEAAGRAGLPTASVQLVPTTDRQAVTFLLAQDRYIDVIIPRGGTDLIRAITASSRIPVVQHYAGICHTYVDADADLQMAQRICLNAKVQRPGVCNAMENLLVHERIAPAFLPPMAAAYATAGVELRGCPRARAIIPSIGIATEEDWRTEYLDLILAIKIVASFDEAIEFIHAHGTGHSDAIVTDRYATAQRFLEEVDSAVVYVNASTRFTDGYEFGFGAEIGISTNRLHARGPMGLRELTTYKYVIQGNGQIRE